MQKPPFDFDSIKHENPYGIEYWSARDLLCLLGYNNEWIQFEHVIKRAMNVCEASNNTVRNHFANARTVMDRSSDTEYEEVDDYHLSRLACYLVAQNGDPRKPEIAAAQIYFAISTRAHEMHELRKEQEARLEMRLKVSESYKALGNAAQHAGVQSENFGVFIDAGYLGLHRHTVEELKERKGIPDNEDYLDRIGRQELSAIDFKNTQTEGKLINDQVQGEDNAIQTHYFVGDQVRKAIEAIQAPMPEDLPPAPSIRALVEERRRSKKKRTLKPKEQGQDSTLF